MSSTLARRAKEMRAEKETKFISDQFEPKDVDHIGFTRRFFEWCRHFTEDEHLRSIDMGLINEDSYERVIRTPVSKRSDLYNDDGVVKEGLAEYRVFMEIDRILG